MPETSDPPSPLQKSIQWVQLVQGGATAIALIAGAWWFMQQRQTFPHAQLTQAVEVVPVDDGLIAVEVQVQFQNTGKVRIDLTDATVKLQNVVAEPYGYVALSGQTGDAYWNAARPVVTPDPRQFNQGELRWPVLNQFKGPIEHVIEPGETDVIVFTFLTPCRTDPDEPASALHFVRIASDIRKPAKGAETNFAWKARAFADVSKVCSGKGSDDEV